MDQLINAQETANTQARYDRIAPFYDLMRIIAEPGFVRWRDRVWSNSSSPGPGFRDDTPKERTHLT